MRYAKRPAKRLAKRYRGVPACLAGCIWLLSAFYFSPFTQAETLGPIPLGSSTGLPLPRYVSLKSDRVNLREGPSKDHRTLWIFQKTGLPVEITAEYENWRRIRDSEGTEGWVLQSLLSGRRTVLIKPWAKKEILSLYAQPLEGNGEKGGLGKVLARLQAGVIAQIRRCDGGWCLIFGEGFEGYMRQADLWGVYPDEKIN